MNNDILFSLQEETIICFYGPPGSGKTTICFQYLIDIVRSGKKVYFIDTEGGFSPERLKQISSNIDLNKVVVFKPKNFEDQHKIFENLIKQITNKNNIGLIIVDSLVMLYRLKLAGEPFKINQTLAEELRILRELALRLKIPIIVTNQMYKDFDTKINKMVGGNILDYWCKIIIELEYENEKRNFVLKKHKHKKIKKKLAFQIEEEGIIAKKKFNLFA